MSKLTWKDLEEKNIAIHTPTEDLMELVVNVIAKKYDDITYEEHIKDHISHKHKIVIVNTCIYKSKRTCAKHKHNAK